MQFGVAALLAGTELDDWKTGLEGGAVGWGGGWRSKKTGDAVQGVTDYNCGGEGEGDEEEGD